MIELAHNLDMRALAEGVEDAETLRLLTEMGCDRAQGFHIGRPQPAADCLAQP
jgi:EAL domain-containing protein (putative c-di-GMP-specific phosphodiesterase class I)